MRALFLILILLAGCTAYDLGDEWSPLSEIRERPSLPVTGDGTVTTIGAHVYVQDLDKFLAEFPPDSHQFNALMQHEREHARRQFRYKGLPGEAAKTAWIARYLTDHEFMWEEEQRGWYLEIRHRAKHGLWNTDWTARIAYALSHEYRTAGGKRMVSQTKARKWIEDVLAGRWKP